MEKNVLSIDIETYSATDIKKSGVYKYVEDESFEITLFAYSIGDSPVYVVDLLSGEKLPEQILQAITHKGIVKTAFNAAFEIACIQKHFGIILDASQWKCTMVLSATAGLCLSLGAVGKVLGLEEQKSSTGAALIRYFCMPCKPTRTNGGRLRNLPHHEPEKWKLFVEYCRQDVVAEKAIAEKLQNIEITETERQLWILDQKINSEGIEVDPLLIENAVLISEDNTLLLKEEAALLTGLDNPNSVSQLKAWLQEEMGVEIEKLTKESVKTLSEDSTSELASRVLTLRKEMSKSSVKKYMSMECGRGEDNRVRGLLQFYGANRTGRWAGRLVQVQNLPQNHIDDLDVARELVRKNDPEMISMCYPNIPDVLSQLIRTAFVAGEGKRFIVSDFSAIEARVIAWLADETWRLDVFATHGKIYEASAAQMFKVPIESIGKGNPLRQKGKIAELALGYQGGVGALTTMGALKMGLVEDELQPLIDVWRKANPNIVKLWYSIEKAAIRAFEERCMTEIKHGVKFIPRKGILFVELPSGRKLAYQNPRLKENKFGKYYLVYDGMDQTKKTWGQVDTYGGKLTENIVQAIARDCLAESMLALDKAGYKIVMHVHDEVVIEVENSNSSQTLEEISEIMGREIPWAKGLLLKAEGYETPYYRKD